MLLFTLFQGANKMSLYFLFIVFMSISICLYLIKNIFYMPGWECVNTWHGYLITTATIFFCGSTALILIAAIIRLFV